MSHHPEILRHDTRSAPLQRRVRADSTIGTRYWSFFFHSRHHVVLSNPSESHH